MHGHILAWAGGLPYRSVGGRRLVQDFAHQPAHEARLARGREVGARALRSHHDDRRRKVVHGTLAGGQVGLEQIVHDVADPSPAQFLVEQAAVLGMVFLARRCGPGAARVHTGPIECRCDSSILERVSSAHAVGVHDIRGRAFAAGRPGGVDHDVATQSDEGCELVCGIDPEPLDQEGRLRPWTVELGHEHADREPFDRHADASVLGFLCRLTLHLIAAFT